MYFGVVTYGDYGIPKSHVDNKFTQMGMKDAWPFTSTNTGA